MKTAVITGATSGIGRYLAFELSKRGYTLGLTGRRIELLESLQAELPGSSIIQKMDVTDVQASEQQLLDMIHQLGHVDVLILNAGIASYTSDFRWEDENRIIQTNVTGFCALLNVYWHYCAEHGKAGHIVGVSSVASHIPNGGSTAYNASKAFISNYMTGLQIKAKKKYLPITITDIKPGFVDTPMTKGQRNMFWVSTPEKACRQIADAIEQKKPNVYITRRWRFAALMARLIPNAFYRKFGR